jgi:hypothetical protein
MPDSIFDLDAPTPNVSLERLRLAVLSTDDLYTLTDVLFGLASNALAAVDALTARVAALETPPIPPVTEPPTSQ